MLAIAVLGGLSTQATASVLYSSAGIAGPDMIVELDHTRETPDENTPLATDIGLTEIPDSAMFLDITDLTGGTREGQFRLFASNRDRDNPTLLNNQLLQINVEADMEAGEPFVEVIGNFGTDRDMVALAYDAVSGMLYGVTTQNFLHIIDLDNPLNLGNAMPIGDVGVDNILSLAFDNNGDLYGVNALNSDLVLIDKNTGAGTVVQDLGVSAVLDIAFDPDDNTLFALAAGETNGSLFKFNSDFSQGTRVDTWTPYEGQLLNGLAFAPGDGPGPDPDPDPDPEPIPEPGTLALLGPAMIALMRRRRH
ncbi:MAG: PEP-CTERM sorting domain-containing protein [Planctomycetota bacterium]